MGKKIIFCGTPTFACHTLQALHDDSAFDVTHVITQPDKPVGRKQVITPPPVKVLAEKLGIPILQPDSINDSEQVRGLRCDFLIVFAYGQILSRELLEMPAISAVNLHLSLLPRHRGASPVQQAILAGDDATGVTVQRMAEKFDTGPLLAQEKSTIDARETSETLYQKLVPMGTRLLLDTLAKPLLETEQDESKATYCKKLTRLMGNVDPQTMTAEEIDRKVRALVPWPGVRMNISRHAERSTGGAGSPTQFLLQNDELSVKTPRSRAESKHEVKLIETLLEPHENALEIPCLGNSTLYVTALQIPGKKITTGASWKHRN